MTYSTDSSNSSSSSTNQQQENPYRPQQQQQHEAEEEEAMFYIGQEEEADDSSFVTASTSTSKTTDDNECKNSSLPVVVVITHEDDDCEVEKFNQVASTNGNHKPRKSVVRSESPTSTMTIIDSDSNNNQDNSSESLGDLSLSSNHSSTSSLAFSSTNSLHRSVSWREEIVTDVIYRPKTKSCEKKELYYNSSDMQRFRQHYKMQMRATQEYQKRVKKQRKEQSKKKAVVVQEEHEESSSSASSARRTSDSLSQSPKSCHQQQLYTSPITGFVNTLTSYLAGTKPWSSSSIQNISTSTSMTSARGPIAETCVLVDTLYLF